MCVRRCHFSYKVGVCDIVRLASSKMEFLLPLSQRLSVLLYCIAVCILQQRPIFKCFCANTCIQKVNKISKYQILYLAVANSIDFEALVQTTLWRVRHCMPTAWRLPKSSNPAMQICSKGQKVVGYSMPLSSFLLFFLLREAQTRVLPKL